MSEREDDLEQQTIELQFQEALNNVRKQNQSSLRPKGECYNCEEAVPESTQLFCDVDCRDDYVKRQRAASQRLY